MHFGRALGVLGRGRGGMVGIEEREGLDFFFLRITNMKGKG